MSFVPFVIQQTGRGERSYDIYSRLLSDRIVILGEEISDALAGTIIAQMLFLEAQDPKRISSSTSTVREDLCLPDLPSMIPCSM